MKNKKAVLVCVTAQQSSHNLLTAGKLLAEKNGANLEVITVLPTDNSDNKYDSDILDKLHAAAKEQGGEMAIYFNDDPIFTVCAHIAKHKPITLVVGFPGENSNNFISTIHLLLPDVPISMVDKDGTVYNMLPQEAVVK